MAQSTHQTSQLPLLVAFGFSAGGLCDVRFRHQFIAGLYFLQQLIHHRRHLPVSWLQLLQQLHRADKTRGEAKLPSVSVGPADVTHSMLEMPFHTKTCCFAFSSARWKMIVFPHCLISDVQKQCAVANAAQQAQHGYSIAASLM